MNVSRANVVRITRIPFPDGTTLVAEGIDYEADCGCRVTYGIRLDKDEKCQLTFPCERHDGALLETVLLHAGQPGHEDYDTPTEELLARVLA